MNVKASQCKCLFETHADEDMGPGLVMWFLRGRLRSLVEDFSRAWHFANGYDMVVFASYRQERFVAYFWTLELLSGSYVCAYERRWQRIYA